jgi:hypothetical protein
MFHHTPHSEGIEGCGGTAHKAPHILSLALDRDKWFASWPRHFTLNTDLNRQLGWPQRLSGCSEDERKLFPCLKLMDDSLVIQLTALPSCTASSCPTSTEAPTLHRAWAFSLGLQAP